MAPYEPTRKRGRGSIDVTPSGSLRVRVFAGYDSVSKKRNYLTEHIPPGPDAEQETEKARVRLVNQVNERRHPRTKATVTQLIEKHLEKANIDPGTLRGYQRNFKNHIEPQIGSTNIGAVDAELLESFYAELRRCRVHCDRSKRLIDHRTTKAHECDAKCVPHKCKPLSNSSVRRIHFLLSGAFKRAVRWDWVTTNPTTTAEPPPEPKANPQPPTAEEAARIVMSAFQDSDWGTLIWFAMTTGGRRGELCALRWQDVDLTTGTVNVRKSIDQYGAEMSEKATKNHQHRRIALDAETVTVVQEHKVRCEARAAALGFVLPADAFMFSLSPDGMTALKPDTATQRYGRLASTLGISTTFHKLRHYSATELITAGVDPRTVGGRLGHSGGGSTTLRVYSAWVAESDQRAAESLAVRMPDRPAGPTDRAERAKIDPQVPYEKIAAEIRHQILDGVLLPGSPAPTQQEIRATHDVSAGTANRVMDLLKTWNLVEASRGRRAIVLQPPKVSSRAVPAEASPRPTEELSDLLDLALFRFGELVRSFTAEANPQIPSNLTRLLTNAARRHGGKEVDIAEYELEIRRSGTQDLISTFAAL
jgi:integrase